MLVIYQESLHDAWSTKCKIFKKPRHITVCSSPFHKIFTYH